VTTLKVAPCSAAVELVGLLDSPEIAELIADLEATRWTGRPGYPIRAMVGMALAKSLYALPTWTRTVRLVREHAALRAPHLAVKATLRANGRAIASPRSCGSTSTCSTPASTPCSPACASRTPAWVRTSPSMARTFRHMRLVLAALRWRYRHDWCQTPTPRRDDPSRQIQGPMYQDSGA
jgi:hypothetical protein